MFSDDRFALLLGALLGALLAAPHPGAHYQLLEAPASVQGPVTDIVHQLDPAEVGKYGEAEQQHREQDQAATGDTEGVSEGLANGLPQNSAKSLRQAGTAHVIHGEQRGARNHHQHQAQGTYGKRDPVKTQLLVAVLEQYPGATGQHQRKDKRQVADEREEDVRQPCAEGATGVVDKISAAGSRPAGIVWRIREQGQQQEQAGCGDADECTLAQSWPKETRRCRGS